MAPMKAAKKSMTTSKIVKGKFLTKVQIWNSIATVVCKAVKKAGVCKAYEEKLRQDADGHGKASTVVTAVKVFPVD